MGQSASVPLQHPDYNMASIGVRRVLSSLRPEVSPWSTHRLLFGSREHLIIRFAWFVIRLMTNVSTREGPHLTLKIRHKSIRCSELYVHVQVLSSCTLRQSPSSCLRLAWRSYAGGINEEFLTTKPGLKAKILDGKRLASQIQKEVGETVNQMTGVGKR